MILELDIGNTRVKWRLIDRAGQPVDTGSVAALDQLPGALAGHALERARVACVRPGELVPIVAEILRSGWGIEPDVAVEQKVATQETTQTFVREKDLKLHLEPKREDAADQGELPSGPVNLEKDFQLKYGLDMLKTWEVFHRVKKAA